MSILGTILGGLFGGGRNVVDETAGVFTVNKEAEAQRGADARSAALDQYAAEFGSGGGLFGNLANALNRLVRPVLVILILAPVLMTVLNPDGGARVWAALAIVPPEYWYLVAAVVAFYFGGRMQVKALSAKSMAAAAGAAAALATGRLAAASEAGAETGAFGAAHDGYGPNAALAEMQSTEGER